MKKLYDITLDGCDDTTYFNMSLDEEEYKLVKKIEKISKHTSTYGCMPTLTIDEARDD